MLQGYILSRPDWGELDVPFQVLVQSRRLGHSNRRQLHRDLPYWTARGGKKKQHAWILILFTLYSPEHVFVFHAGRTDCAARFKVRRIHLGVCSALSRSWSRCSALHFPAVRVHIFHQARWPPDQSYSDFHQTGKKKKKKKRPKPNLNLNLNQQYKCCKTIFKI